MKLTSKPTITFTAKEYEAFNKVCMMLDDLVNGDYRMAFEIIMEEEDGMNLDILYGMFATLTDYVEEHRE